MGITPLLEGSNDFLFPKNARWIGMELSGIWMVTSYSYGKKNARSTSDVKPNKNVIKLLLRQ